MDMAHQPNLADLKRMLGLNLFLDLGDHADEHQRARVGVQFSGFESFQCIPAFLMADGKIIGREAFLRALISSGEAIAPQARSVRAGLLQGNYLGQPEFVSEARRILYRNERLAA